MHSPWVVGAYAALFNVTTIVSLQNIQGLSPGQLHSLVPRGTNPKEIFRPHPTSWWPLSNLVREAGPSCSFSSRSLGPSWVQGLTKKRPESALAWARVQGQSGSSVRKLGSWSSNASQARHCARAQATGSARKSSPRCQASA